MAKATQHHFRSLRLRLLGPMIATALVAAVLVAMASYWLGARWARSELEQRFVAIQETLADATFPLNTRVLDSLAKLTQTELVTYDQAGKRKHSTVAVQQESGSTHYLMLDFATLRPGSRSDGVFRVAVLFDQRQIDASQRRAAILPLATGLSTILALSSITLVLSSRLVGRIARLQHRVEAVADGDFQSSVSDNVADEVGRLGGAVDAMAGQLNQLWKQVNRQQSQKLLHQIAGGMAHQLRNSLTGARMAVELHAANCEQTDDEGLRIAIHQIELSEDYVRRLLLVASGRQDEDRPRKVADCWNDVKTSLTPLARHLRIDVQWTIDERITGHTLKDGPSWIAAVTNLIHNAIEAGEQVKVDLKRSHADHIRLEVADNGAGLSPSVADELFDPFVTSKPEGMGLGLSVVWRAAEHLGGRVHWERRGDWTVFVLDAEAACVDV